MTTSLEELGGLVLESFAATQDSLVLLEQEAQRQDRPVVHALSSAYARLLSPLRDYIASANMGRPLPRQLSKRLSEPADVIFDHADEVTSLRLQPDAAGIARLIQAAETAL